MIGIIKTSDLRNEYLASYFDEKEVIYSDKLTDFYNLKYLVLPPQGITSNYYLKDSCISILDIYAVNPGITYFFCILAQENLKEFCIKNNIKLISLLDIESFVYDNALLTSEGLFKVLINEIDTSLKDLSILILGYGYCANAIKKHLSGFNDDLYFYTKNEQELKSIFLEGQKSIENLNELDDFDIIINTIPCVIVDEVSQKTIKNNAKLYDIASYPYGFDLDAAKSLGLKVNILPQIPGRIFPKNASCIMYENIKEFIC